MHAMRKKAKDKGRFAKLRPSCPQCRSPHIYKDGLRYLMNKAIVQRFLCKNCGFRFSKQQKLSSDYRRSKTGKYAFEGMSFLTKNLPKAVTALTETTNRSSSEQAGATQLDAKGKILGLAWSMKKLGYSEETIRLHVSALRTLHDRGADLYDSESVKGVIAKQNWSNARRRNVINAYGLFLKRNGLQWEKPKCKVAQKLPFIPTEQELDSLIAGAGKKTSTFLQLLKETAMRAGEAKRLKWTDLDFERHTIMLNDPEKGSNPRIWKASEKLIGMLKCLPNSGQKVFGDTTYDSLKQTLQLTRKRLAYKLQNPRLLKITFHTFRHWKATTLYHQTKDPYYVKDFLGHKSIKNTEIYITIERTIFSESDNDEFTVKIANKPEEIKNLLEVGFQYICEKDGTLFFRKRK